MLSVRIEVFDKFVHDFTTNINHIHIRKCLNIMAF